MSSRAIGSRRLRSRASSSSRLAHGIVTVSSVVLTLTGPSRLAPRAMTLPATSNPAAATGSGRRRWLRLSAKLTGRGSGGWQSVRLRECGGLFDGVEDRGGVCALGEVADGSEGDHVFG